MSRRAILVRYQGRIVDRKTSIDISEHFRLCVQHTVRCYLAGKGHPLPKGNEYLLLQYIIHVSLGHHSAMNSASNHDATLLCGRAFYRHSWIEPVSITLVNSDYHLTNKSVTRLKI
ncbi:hypothetical protein TNCV_1452051 [Trichonephila clavipes]|nr:hypothetical protein TNCV_1452051 [Trichonephila clavipes]